MAASPLAQHLPALFGPSRRAAWRLGVLRRALAALAILLAIQLALDALRPSDGATTSPRSPSGPELSLPLAMPADHLSPGDRVGVYLPGREEPVVRSARFGGTSESTSGQTVARITLSDNEIGRILRHMGVDGPTQGGFVLVGEGGPDTAGAS
ncbi:hypothetical protein ACQBJO_02470 [Janibacter sp. G349]|uniref:hypothetical protein n=1 Tax=unclassified Janibacter TaxID=2649294 RepID=UPI003B7B88A0